MCDFLGVQCLCTNYLHTNRTNWIYGLSPNFDGPKFGPWDQRYLDYVDE